MRRAEGDIASACVGLVAGGVADEMGWLSRVVIDAPQIIRSAVIAADECLKSTPEVIAGGARWRVAKRQAADSHARFPTADL